MNPGTLLWITPPHSPPGLTSNGVGCLWGTPCLPALPIETSDIVAVP